MSYKNIITWDKINQIKFREPLEIQTIQPKEYMKCAKEFGYAAGPYAIYTNYLHGYSSHIDILRDNSIDDQSYTYNILSHLSITGDWWYASDVFA